MTEGAGAIRTLLLPYGFQIPPLSKKKAPLVEFRQACRLDDHDFDGPGIRFQLQP